MRINILRRQGNGLTTRLLVMFAGTLCAAQIAVAAPANGTVLRLDHGLAGTSLQLDDNECSDEAEPVLPAIGTARALPASSPAGALPYTKLAASTSLSSGSARSSGDSAVAPKSATPVVVVVAQNMAAPPKAAQTWEIVPSDKTLNAALARWAAAAGWQLVWELPVDYAVETRAAVPGTFEEAVTLVTKSMDSAEIPLKAIFYQGNKVLRVVGKGVE